MRSEDDVTTLSLFEDAGGGAQEGLATGAVIVRGFGLPDETALVSDLRGVTAMAPFRHMVTPGGYRMSVAMSNCGALGWVTDRTGYRYDGIDPESGESWPAMPASFLKLAKSAAAAAGFSKFLPAAFLINRF